MKIGVKRKRAGASVKGSDNWEDGKNAMRRKLSRRHRTPRSSLFTPYGVAGGPTQNAKFGPVRKTEGIRLDSGREFTLSDHWRVSENAHRDLGFQWVGRTTFTVVPGFENALNGDDDNDDDTDGSDSAPRSMNYIGCNDVNGADFAADYEVVAALGKLAVIERPEQILNAGGSIAPSALVGQTARRSATIMPPCNPKINSTAAGNNATMGGLAAISDQVFCDP